VSYFVDTEDGQAYDGSDADTKKDFCGCRPLCIGPNSLELNLIELFAVELTNAIDEDGDGFIEPFIARVLSAGSFDVGRRGPEQCVGLGIENAKDELRVVNDGSVRPSRVY